jgi:hypothetical protein
MATPKDFKYDSFKKLKPKSVVEPGNLKTNMTFLHNHYIHYPKLSKTKYASVKDATKLSKLKHDRVNMLRQMVPGLKKTRDNVNAMLNSLTSGDKDHDKFKVVLMGYLELLRKAERDRQKWMKDEIALGNAENVKSLLQNPGLDDVIRI